MFQVWYFYFLWTPLIVVLGQGIINQTFVLMYLCNDGPNNIRGSIMTPNYTARWRIGLAVYHDAECWSYLSFWHSSGPSAINRKIFWWSGLWSIASGWLAFPPTNIPMYFTCINNTTKECSLFVRWLFGLNFTMTWVICFQVGGQAVLRHIYPWKLILHFIDGPGWWIYN